MSTTAQIQETFGDMPVHAEALRMILSKVPMETLGEIADLYLDGASKLLIARRFDIGVSTIHKILYVLGMVERNR